MQEVSNKDFSYLKKQLADLLIETICPIGKKINSYMKEKSFLEVVLKKGKEKASIKAEENLKKIREIIGFV